MRLLLASVIAYGLHSVGVAYDFAPMGLVDHPLTLSGDTVRTRHVWNSGNGGMGESLGQEFLRLRGFHEIYEVKNKANNGLDRVAIKRGPDGRVTDVRLVEMKTTKSPTPRLNNTKSGVQMSRDYLARKLKDMRASTNPRVRRLAREIRTFVHESKRPIGDFCEVMHFDTKRLRFTTYGADARTIKETQSLHRTFSHLMRTATAPEVRQWAYRHLRLLPEIRKSRMTDWLSQTQPAAQSYTAGSRLAGVGGPRAGTTVVRLASQSLPAASSSASRKALSAMARRAGPIATVVFTALDIYAIESDYQQNRMSLRRRSRSYAELAGGVSGSLAMGAAGATGGIYLGALTGPFAPVAVPVLGFVGGVGGAAIGYWGGTSGVSYGLDQWYDAVDESLQRRFEERFVSIPFPTNS